MKRIMLFLVAAYSCLQLLAAPNEKVLERFQSSFPDATDVSWSDDNDAYVVYFVKDQLQFRIWYNRDGKVQQTIRYYDASRLNPYVYAKVREKYSDWTPKLVTELTSDAGMEYQITIMRGDEWYDLRSNAYGELSVEKKYRTK